MTSRWVSALLAVAAALAVAACGPKTAGTGQPPAFETSPTQPVPAQSSPTPRPIPSPTPTASPSPVPTATRVAGPPVDRIAFVGVDNQVYTIDATGTGLRQITPMPSVERGPVPGYTWPTWSPDGRSILMSAVVPDPESPGGRLVVYVVDEGSPDSGLRTIHQDRRGSGGILPGVFHYAIWSPDGEQVAIIAVGLNDLAVFISSLDDNPARPILGGAPMYVTWSWDSARVYVHQRERLMMFNLAGGEAAQSLGASGRYQAPVAAANPGGRLAYVVDGADGTSDIVVTDPDGGHRTEVVEVPDLTAIQWAPDGRRLAIGRTVGDDAQSYGEILIADLDTGQVRKVLERPIYAFEWSPDGGRILIAERHPEIAGVFRWSVLEVGDGSVRHLIDLRPTDEFAQMLVYFDQYAQSHRLWAPDGDSFVLAGDTPEHAPTVDDDLLERVWVVDADGREPPQPIAVGYLAFWSPR